MIKNSQLVAVFSKVGKLLTFTITMWARCIETAKPWGCDPPQVMGQNFSNCWVDCKLLVYYWLMQLKPANGSSWRHKISRIHIHIYMYILYSTISKIQNAIAALVIDGAGPNQKLDNLKVPLFSCESRDVTPKSSVMESCLGLLLAPDSTRNVTTSTCPLRAAVNGGVSPVSVLPWSLYVFVGTRLHQQLHNFKVPILRCYV